MLRPARTANIKPYTACQLPVSAASDPRTQDPPAGIGSRREIPDGSHVPDERIRNYCPDISNIYRMLLLIYCLCAYQMLELVPLPTAILSACMSFGTY